MQYFIDLTKTRMPIMKETPRRRITVKLSVIEISSDQLGNGEGVSTPSSTSRFLDRYLKTTCRFFLHLENLLYDAKR